MKFFKPDFIVIYYSDEETEMKSNHEDVIEISVQEFPKIFKDKELSYSQKYAHKKKYLDDKFPKTGLHERFEDNYDNGHIAPEPRKSFSKPLF